MAMKTAVKLKDAAEEREEELPAPVIRRLNRYEQMLEVSSWSNRLDARLQETLRELAGKIETWRETAAAVSATASEEADGLLHDMDYALKELLPEIIELAVVASDHVYFLDRKVAEVSHTAERIAQLLSSVESSKPFRAARRLLNKLQTSSAEEEEVVQTEDPRRLSADHLFFDYFDTDYKVENDRSPMAVYDDWVTMYRKGNRAYGSKQPVYTDIDQRLVNLHALVSFRDKKILELGPFEGANTKQLVDLGASEVVAIEANRDAFIKCLLVKETFKLQNLELIYDDFNLLIEDPDFLARGFDICFAAGVLYHMHEPLKTIERLTKVAPLIYVHTHIASDKVPSGEWLDLKDDAGNSYRGRKNFYATKKHWGGVKNYAVWLDETSMLLAFRNLGFDIQDVYIGRNDVRGDYISFVAVNRSKTE